LDGGLPPRGRRGRFGSKGRIFSHWASVSSRPYRAIVPPLALLPNVIPHFPQSNHHPFSPLYPVLKQLLTTARNPNSLDDGIERMVFLPNQVSDIC
jgi:hypothetical protein